mmetsp:Transcript_58315/g.138991  ORF Transcript_58315/g.138991 Transcript_58315/m.138991 type:complete len:319 (+) Transcript_58315:85-1041(+)
MTSPLVSPQASPSGASQFGAAEVETELEDNAETDYVQQRLEYAEVEEVDEDEDLDVEEEDARIAEQTQYAGSDGGSMSSTPSAKVEVWKQFGCDTEAGRALRKLYGNIGQNKAAAQISYPKVRAAPKKLEPAAPKPCPQRAAVNVPKPGQRRAVDPDDPRYWRMPAGGRKPAKEIMAEMQASKVEKPDLPEGRDHAAEKQRLQDKFRYCGGNAMPKGAMGYVPKGEMPVAKPRAPEERLDFFDEAAGMTVEQRQIFEELVQAVKRKQDRLAEIDAENAAEDGKPSKARTARNKEALQLQNDIRALTADVELLLKVVDR